MAVLAAESCGAEIVESKIVDDAEHVAVVVEQNDVVVVADEEDPGGLCDTDNAGQLLDNVERIALHGRHGGLFPQLSVSLLFVVVDDERAVAAEADQQQRSGRPV